MVKVSSRVVKVKVKVRAKMALASFMMIMNAPSTPAQLAMKPKTRYQNKLKKSKVKKSQKLPKIPPKLRPGKPYKIELAANTLLKNMKNM